MSIVRLLVIQSTNQPPTSNPVRINPINNEDHFSGSSVFAHKPINKNNNPTASVAANHLLKKDLVTVDNDHRNGICL
jgi:hypothetical protein